MRLSWNEIRVRAAAFADDWAGEGYEKGQTQLFYRDFFDVFGVPVRRVASFEEPVKKLGDKRGFIDLFWKGMLLVEQKSAGRDLAKAKKQALDYFPGLKDAELPRYLMLSDFQTFELFDLGEDEELSFPLEDLHKHVEKFGFIIGVKKREFRDQDPANVKASELVGKIHDALEDVGYGGADLEQFLVRLVFCLFADDTGIFEPRDIFLEYIDNRTSEDGSDLGAKISQLFQTLDTPEDERSNALDEDLAQFPYINGDLFNGAIRIPSFSSEMRSKLIDACQFDWSEISPAIFGALFQSVMEPAERRAQGAHYTTEKNIMKVIGPLFLDALHVEFEHLRERKDSRRQSALRRFHERLGELVFFDPACGCGNFLIITYRELRLLEIEVLKEIRKHRDDDRTRELDIGELCKVDVDQFYGIEIGQFPAKIAETALWMMDHFMNNRVSLEFGQSFTRIPLKKSPHIVCADALETDWSDVISPGDCSYVLGNAPFIGAKYQTDEQRAQVRRIASLSGSGGTLDYVTAWFLKAGEFVRDSAISIGFVATNSITQGEQVAQLWPLLFGRFGLEITFGHRTFEWGSDAKGKAHVHVVIIGLARAEHVSDECRLFSYEDIQGEPHESSHSVITPYLFDGSNLSDPHLVVQEVSRPLNGLPQLKSGSQPIDGGHYIFNFEQRAEFLALEPTAEVFLRPYIGSREYLNAEQRWILALQNATPAQLRSMPYVVERMKQVKKARLKSKRKSTLAIANYPEKYNVELIPEDPFLVIPEVSSQRREYIPMAWLEPPVIPSNKIRILPKAKLWQFCILTSAMHMSWVRHINGRLKSDYQYGIGIAYNNFPIPDVSKKRLKALRPLAQEIIDARRDFPDSSLADLYDPDVMPERLRRAHIAVDGAVEKLYRRSTFSSDRERVEHLFGLYEKLVSPLISGKKKRRKRK